MNLIDKDALVANIEEWHDNIIKAISDIPLTGRDRADATFEYEILGKVKDSLDFFEVKEIDLKKELDYDDYVSFFKEHPDYNNVDWGFEECWVFAKHFFELGLKTMKGE